MSDQTDQISLADQLLKQLQDQYLAVHAQNIIMPQQNNQPDNDPQNPYQSLQFDDQQDQDSLSDQQNHEQNQNEQSKYPSEEEKLEDDVQNFKKQIQSIRIQQTHSNPQMKELIEVLPVDQKIYIDLPVKDFEIDQQKIKTFALSMDIKQPDWLQNQTLCKLRIQELFIKKSIQKPFTKI